MIQLLCPVCNSLSKRCQVKFSIEIEGSACFTISRSGVLAFGLSKPIALNNKQLNSLTLNLENLICVSCGATAPANVWKIRIDCDLCDNEVLTSAIEPKNAMQYVCESSWAFLCSTCWEKQLKSTYCKNCSKYKTCKSEKGKS